MSSTISLFINQSRNNALRLQLRRRLSQQQRWFAAQQEAVDLAGAAVAGTSRPNMPPKFRPRAHSTPKNPPTTAAVGSTATKFALPVKHRLRQLPPVCTDSKQLQEWTAQILNSPKGSLFAFQESDPPSAEAAWLQADATVQKVEFILRGHAHGLPGTQWNRWLASAAAPTTGAGGTTITADYTDETLTKMQALLDRLWEEGQVYMTLRAARLEELQGPKALLDDENDSESKAAEEAEEEEEEEEIEDETEDSPLTKQEEEEIEKALLAGRTTESVDEDAEETEVTYMDDFALPGPTVAMYDIMLDALACQAGAGGKVVTPLAALGVLHDVQNRHRLDGGDDDNANIYTRPTVLSFNAPIRLAANLPFDPLNKKGAAIRRRDEAIELAFGCFGELSSSTLVHRNSATYCYLLLTVAKYMPTSRIKGNIAHGIFHHACTQGLIDETVLDAYKLAQTPSNGPEFESWMRRNWKEEKKDLPTTWVRHSRQRRYHPREATY